MSLTPEQFKNIIQEVVKDELCFVHDKIDKNHSEVMNAVDSLTKDHEDHKDEHVANLGAHDRMQMDINECRKKLNLRVVPVFKDCL